MILITFTAVLREDDLGGELDRVVSQRKDRENKNKNTLLILAEICSSSLNYSLSWLSFANEDL